MALRFLHSAADEGLAAANALIGKVSVISCVIYMSGSPLVTITPRFIFAGSSAQLEIPLIKSYPFISFNNLSV